MDGSNDMIKGLLGTATANPAGANVLTNPAMKNIATNGKLIIQNLGELTKAISTLTTNWGA